LGTSFEVWIPTGRAFCEAAWSFRNCIMPVNRERVFLDWPTGSRRYGRLAACGTTSRLMVRWNRTAIPPLLRVDRQVFRSRGSTARPAAGLMLTAVQPSCLPLGFVCLHDGLRSNLVPVLPGSRGLARVLRDRASECRQPVHPLAFDHEIYRLGRCRCSR
jgi:hypothetical protein